VTVATCILCIGAGLVARQAFANPSDSNDGTTPKSSQVAAENPKRVQIPWFASDQYGDPLPSGTCRLGSTRFRHTQKVADIALLPTAKHWRRRLGMLSLWDTATARNSDGSGSPGATASPMRPTAARWPRGLWRHLLSDPATGKDSAGSPWMTARS